MVIIVNVQPEKILAFRFVGKANHDYGLLPEMLYDPAVRLDNEACEMQTDKVPRIKCLGIPKGPSTIIVGIWVPKVYTIP